MPIQSRNCTWLFAQYGFYSVVCALDLQGPPTRKREDEMIGPAKNRLHDYEAGWLTLLIRMGVASTDEAEAAMNRVAQAAIDEQEARRQRRKRGRRRRKPPE